MSLMLKLLATTLLLSSFIYAQSTSEKVEDYIVDEFNDDRFSRFDTDVVDVIKLKDLSGWSAYIVELEVILKKQPSNVIKQRMMMFSNGTIVTKELANMDTGENIKDLIKPNFQPDYYTKENLIYGNPNARHKIAIFSDPLCPFCKKYVPAAINEMRKYPNKYAIYYYHLPLPTIHPASIALVKAATAAEQKGFKDVVLKIYNIDKKFNPREKDIKKILAAFNKAVGSDIKPQDLNAPSVIKHARHDGEVANKLMVGGTPTIYVDGKIDLTKKKYKVVQ